MLVTAVLLKRADCTNLCAKNVVFSADASMCGNIAMPRNDANHCQELKYFNAKHSNICDSSVNFNC